MFPIAAARGNFCTKCSNVDIAISTASIKDMFSRVQYNRINY